MIREFIRAHSIRNKQAIVMSAEGAMDANKTVLQSIAANPVGLRDYLMWPLVYSAMAREQEIT